MPSSYIKCDKCGDVLDRYPPELNRVPGTFSKFTGHEVRVYGAALGWTHIPSETTGDLDKDFCPKCSTTPKAGE